MPTSQARIDVFSQFKLGCIDVFDAILALDKASALDDRQRKDGGVVYTPRTIASGMCTLAAPKLSARVFDPSCGRGVFVFALAEYHLTTLDPLVVHDTMARHLWACDIDRAAVEDLRALWILYWQSKGIARPTAPHLASEDSLFGSFSLLNFDLTLGNPPYVRFQNLPETYRSKLQASFASCAKGNVDIYFAFVEKALSQSLRTCLIIPNSWMSSASGKSLRVLLAEKMLFLADYGSQLPFAPVRAYVCVVLAQKEDRQAEAPMKVQLDGFFPEKPWIPISSGDPRVSPSRWTLSALTPPSPAPAAKAIRTLGDIAVLRSGIATLADSTYAISQGRLHGAHIEFIDPLTSAPTSVAAALAPKKIKLTKVKSESDMVNWTERILFPYALDGSLIPFTEIESAHADAAAFLGARKKTLALRDKGKQEDYPEWHAYGRKQGLKPLPQGMLCALSTMSEGALRAFTFNPVATGPFLFTSGFILAPKPGSSVDDILAALVHESSWAWILARGKPWAGPDGKAYRSYGARLLLSLPLP